MALRWNSFPLCTAGSKDQSECSRSDSSLDRKGTVVEVTQTSRRATRCRQASSHQSSGAAPGDTATGSTIGVKPEDTSAHPYNNADACHKKSVSSACQLPACQLPEKPTESRVNIPRKAAYVEGCSEIVLVTLDDVCSAVRNKSRPSEAPSSSPANAAKPRNNRLLARSLTTSDMSVQIQNIQEPSNDTGTENDNSRASHLTSSGVLFVPSCSSGPGRRRQNYDPGYAQARLCKRHYERRNALADPWSMTMPQDTRERIQEEVASRKKSVTRKVSRCLLGIFTDDYEVDLV